MGMMMGGAADRAAPAALRGGGQAPGAAASA